MKTHKVTACLYKDDKGKTQRGLFILNRRSNTVTILDKHLNKVKADLGLETLECTEGCIYFDLSKH